jgi:DNA-binding response OmpR family regulator
VVGALIDADRAISVDAGCALYERTIDAQISRLRKKIETDPKHPKLIKSVHGDGYVFTATVSKFVAATN